MEKVVLGVIGGSGLYDLPECKVIETVNPETPFGFPSAPLVKGTVGDLTVFFLARHGVGHRFNPSEVPYRANIWALRAAGVTHVLAVNAVGSLKLEIRPGDLAVPDQIIDRTKGNRPSTYFEDGIVAHAGFADPYCLDFSARLADAARTTGKKVHQGGTLVCMEGPQFSTRAESRLYISFGAHLIGMTALPEAKLAREAGLCYASLCLATDYDCWHEAEGDVNVEAVVQVMHQNVAAARRTVVQLAADLAKAQPDCKCRHTIQRSVMTNHSVAGEAARKRLALLLEDR
jgi:5'-methylthioadenosine phosphorylase